MIVAISEGKILAHADLATECAEKMMSSTLAPGMVRYRPASPALQALIESGASTEGLDLVIGDTADLAPGDEEDKPCEYCGFIGECSLHCNTERYREPEEIDQDIRRIREHVIAKALENTK